MDTVEFPRVVDRNVATPSLVKLTNIESNIYNVEPETGTVVEEGTPLDSDLFAGIKNYVDYRDTVSFDINNCDLDDIKTNGIYKGYTNIGHRPLPGNGISIVTVKIYSKDWIEQTFIDPHENWRVYRRVFHSGTTWSDWVLTDTNNSSAIFSEGFINGWKYYKLEDGTGICIKSDITSDVTFSQSYGSSFLGSKWAQPASYPFQFIDIPVTQISQRSGDNNFWVNGSLIDKQTATTTTAPRAKPIHAVKHTEPHSIITDYLSIGRWK